MSTAEIDARLYEAAHEKLGSQSAQANPNLKVREAKFLRRFATEIRNMEGGECVTARSAVLRLYGRIARSCCKCGEATADKVITTGRFALLPRS